MLKKVFRTIGYIYMMLFIFVSFTTASAQNGWHIDEIYEIQLNSDSWDLKRFEKFVPSVGDYFLVDLDDAIGYLVNDDSKTYTSFPIISGAKGTPTPEEEWVVKQKNIQPNRIVFGDTGEFLRMYKNEGRTHTGYGIHNYAYFEEEVEKGTKYLSLGCILVSEEVHNKIEESYLANGESLYMETKNEIFIPYYLELELF